MNCWTVSGDCVRELRQGQILTGWKKNSQLLHEKRNQYHNLNQYPIFVFYPNVRDGIIYNGPITYHHIMEFILAAKHPVKHITNADDWENFNVLHGGFSLAGYFPNLHHSKSSNRYFQTFLSTSYLMLEVDPFRTYLGGVAAITSSSLAAHVHLNLTSGPPIRFYTWNGTSFAYPNKTIGSNPTSNDMLFKWVKSKALQSEPLMGWAGTSGRKSVLLSNWLMQNPSWNSGYSLLAFFDRSTRNNYEENYSVYQEAALRYKTCKDARENSKQSTYSLLEGIRKMRRSSFLKKDAFGSTKMVDCLTDPWFTRSFADGTSNCDDYSSCPFRSNVTAKYDKKIDTSSLKNDKSHETDYYRLSHGRFRRPILGRPQVDHNIRFNYIMNSRLECVLLFTQGKVQVISIFSAGLRILRFA